MSNFVKFLFVFILITPIAIILMLHKKNSGVEFYATGVITEAQWNTRNHQMSLFLIKGKHSTKKLHHQDVILTPEQIKVGDSFKKNKGSKVCLINNEEIICIR